MAASRAPLPSSPPTGPAADYPVVIGPPFTVDGAVWTPTDQLNYDAVGKAVMGADTGSGVTAAHKTLPLPCYVEVTSLNTGRTILVRIERRGPMTNDALIALSPEAAAQLGASAGDLSVRVRRVNPPEQERAMLRAGGRAPERMETPEGLLKVLRRKLADQSPLLPPPSTPPAMPAGTPPVTAHPGSAPAKAATPAAQPKPQAPVEAASKPEQKAAVKSPVAAPAPRPAPKPAPASPAAESRGSVFVQVAAFSSESSARKVAAQLGGSVSASGRFWRVRLGPYTNRAKAAPALEKAKGAGYRDARILGAD